MLTYNGSVQKPTAEANGLVGDDQVIESWPNEVQISPVIDERHPEIIGVKRVF